MLYGPEHFHILIIEVYIIISFLDKISEKKMFWSFQAHINCRATSGN